MSIGIFSKIQKGGADFASVVEIYIVAVYSYHMGSVWSMQVTCSRFGHDPRNCIGDNACRCGGAVLQSGRAARRHFSGDCLSDQPLRFATVGGMADGEDRRYQLCLAGFPRKLNHLIIGGAFRRPAYFFGGAK